MSKDPTAAARNLETSIWDTAFKFACYAVFALGLVKALLERSG